MSEDKLFSPEFVFKFVLEWQFMTSCARIFPWHFVAQHYSSALSEHYRSISEEEISYPAEQILRFVSEQKPQHEAHDKANFFIYNRLKFDGIKGERKLKGIFVMLLLAINQKYSQRRLLKTLKPSFLL